MTVKHPKTLLMREEKGKEVMKQVRQPEEEPGVAWDVSSGVRMSESSIQAVAAEFEQDLDRRLEPLSEPSEEELMRCTEAGRLALSKLSKPVPPGLPLRETLKQLYARSQHESGPAR